MANVSERSATFDDVPWPIPPHIDLVEEGKGGWAIAYSFWQPEVDFDSYYVDAGLGGDVLGEFLGLFGRHTAESFEDFVNRDSLRGSLLAFARRYGPLGFCRHGLYHRHRSPWHRWTVGVEPVETIEPCQPLQPEPLSRWWDFAARLRSFVRLGQAVSSGRAGEAADWAVVGHELGESEPGLVVAEVLGQSWLDQAGFSPRLLWKGGTLGIEPMAHQAGLFGTLMKHAVFAASKTSGFFVCSGCGTPYPRRGRRPKPGQGNFCPNCRKRDVREKLAMRRYRAGRRDPR